MTHKSVQSLSRTSGSNDGNSKYDDLIKRVANLEKEVVAINQKLNYTATKEDLHNCINEIKDEIHKIHIRLLYGIIGGLYWPTK